jgi:hypothetical protein
MSRSLSTLARQSLYGAETGEVWLLLLTIDHDDLAAPIRVVNNMENVTSNGEVYTAFPFTLTLPGEQEDQPPRLRLAIDNVDRTIVASVRGLSSAPTVQLDVCLASQPDTIEASFPGFTLRQAGYDHLVVEGDLTLEELVTEPFPEGSFTPQFFPGLYG